MSGMGAAAQSLVFGAVELRLDERRLLIDGQPVGLGSRGFDLLRALVAKRDRVVSKDELLDEVWPGLVVEENNLQVQISGLRRVLGAGAIATVAGLGYRFTLALGGAEPQAVVPAPIPALALGATLAAKVLVADDNKVNRLLLCRSLELMGHTVSAASNGREALEMLRRQRFDLLLLDLAMPELDGFGLLQARTQDAALREVAVIVTSALGGVAPVARCIELGADDFLHKPVDPALLKARVDSSLARKQLRDQQSEALRRTMPSGPGAAQHLADATVLVTQLGEPDLLALLDQPELTLALLNDWATLVFDAIESRGGEIVRFSGAAVTARFEAPREAVLAARDLVEVLALLNTDRAAAGQSAVRAGIGVARGPLVVGTVAAARRATYACVGAPVQAAELLATTCAREAQPLLMDADTRAGLSAAEWKAVVQWGGEP